jgi:hypothetical protein
MGLSQTVREEMRKAMWETQIHAIELCIKVVKRQLEMPNRDDSYRAACNDILTFMQAGLNRVKQHEIFNPTTKVD